MVMDLNWLQQWTQMVSSSPTIAEFGKKLVHSPLTPPTTVGVQVYQLDTKGRLNLAGGYGINPLGNSSYSAWDDNFLAEAIQEQGLATSKLDHEGINVFSFGLAMMKGDQPVGVAVVYSKESIKNFPAEVNQAMSQVLGLWFYSLGLVSDKSKEVSGELNPEQLTERQIKILEHISQGMTNAEIAQELILSESSIRQETVRIYRALGVDSRSEAAKRAIHLGIIRQSAIAN
jgi:DNA-binding CsgD family transcriptional regulator